MTNEAACTIILRAAVVIADTVLMFTVCAVTNALRDAMVCVLFELITTDWLGTVLL